MLDPKGLEPAAVLACRSTSRFPDEIAHGGCGADWYPSLEHPVREPAHA